IASSAAWLAALQTIRVPQVCPHADTRRCSRRARGSPWAGHSGTPPGRVVMEPSQQAPTVLNIDSATRIGRSYSVALTGIKGQIVCVEADIGNALPGFTLLGLPDQSLQEAKDRI